jgi:hypothetical protein
VQRNPRILKELSMSFLLVTALLSEILAHIHMTILNSTYLACQVTVLCASIVILVRDTDSSGMLIRYEVVPLICGIAYSRVSREHLALLSSF